jgi:peptide/nickel transport system substrate-binding protein
VQHVRNPDYWNREAPRVDRLRINHYPDEESGAQAFLAGQVSYAVQVPLAQFPDYQARADQGDLTIDVIDAGWLYFGMNHEVEPYDNPKVRKAISLALDRRAMAQAPFSNLARPQWFGGIATNHPWYPADLEFERDVEQARSLLTEAGFANGFSDVLLTLGDKDYFVGINQIAQQNLAEIGVTIDLEVVDIATILERTFTTQDFTICSLGDAVHPEPAAQLDVYFSSNGGNNYFNYSSDEADRLMRRARETFDEAGRQRAYREVFQLLFVDDIAAIPVTTEPSLGIYTGTNVDQWGPDPIARMHYPIATVSS